jgi:diguanylate cyclase (GGDEF)-like protein
MVSRPGEGDAPHPAQRPAPLRDELQGLLRGIARVDWLAMVLVVLYFAVDQHKLPNPWVTATALGVFTIFLIVFRTTWFPVHTTSNRLLLDVAITVLFITVVVSQTGGLDSPLASLFLLPMVLAAVALGPRLALATFVVVTACFVIVEVIVRGVAGLSVAFLARLYGELVPFALVAYLTGQLSASMITARRRIQELAERDGLTGLINMRTFNELLRREHADLARNDRTYSVLMVDMDRLKPVNDTWGHEAGNRAIAAIAGALERSIRGSDVAARYGGDEFVLFLPDADVEQANTIAQRVRNNAFNSQYEAGGRLQRGTVSVGVATFPRDGRNPAELLVVADRRMYRDKELRRAPPPAAPGSPRVV